MDGDLGGDCLAGGVGGAADKLGRIVVSSAAVMTGTVKRCYVRRYACRSFRCCS